MRTLKEREWFFSQEKLPVELTNPVPECNIYRLACTGQTVCEITLDCGFGGEPTVIGMTTDIHFNLCTKEDAEDPETAYTEQCRLWLANGKSVPQAINALDAMSYCDAGVVTGDILDYISLGAIDLTKRLIINKYPDYLLAPGGHDITKQMQTKLPDQLPLEERLNILKAFWPHDLHYASRVINDKVIIVALDNGQSKYLDGQAEKLAADIKKAREEGKVVLIFQHEPIAVNDPDDCVRYPVILASGAHKSICVERDAAINDSDKCDDVTRRVYRMIIENADVVRGVFAGHWHSQFYCEIKGSYEKGGEKIPAAIPQHIIYGNPYYQGGYIARIIVR